MGFLSLRGTISGVAAVSVALVAALTLGITLSSSLVALRDIGLAHAAALLDGAQVKTYQHFDAPLIITEVMQNFTAKYSWNWPSDDPTVHAAFSQLHETQFFSSQLKSASLLTYTADNTRFFYGPFIPDDSLYVRQDHIASSITAADWNFTEQTIRNEVDFRFMSNHSEVPRSHWAWTVPLALSKVRLDGLWDGLLLTATGQGQITVTAPISLVNFGGISNLYVPIFAPLYRLGESPATGNLFGVSISALYIDDISNFLRSIRGTPNTAAFAVDGGGHIISSSVTAEYPYQVEEVVAASASVPSGCASTADTSGVSTNTDVIRVCRTHASAYGFAPLRTMAGLSSPDGSATFLSYDGRYVVHTDGPGGDKFYFATVRLPLRTVGLQVQLLLSMPEQDLIGDVIRSRNIAIGVTCAVFVVVVVVVCVLITVLLAPLSDIADRMLDASNFCDDADRGSVSAMAEVAALQEAYYEMNDELNRIRSFVPQSVLAVRGGADEIDEDLEETVTETQDHNDTSTQRSNASRLSRSARSRRASVAAGASNAGRSIHSSGKRSSLHSDGGATGDITVMRLKAQPVTVLVVNGVGFTAAAKHVTNDVTSEALGSLLETVLSEVTTHKGVLGAFNGDHIVASFNAVKPCSSHARRAAFAAIAITNDPGVRGMKLAVRCGIASGRCMVGNAGCADARSFNIVGPAFSQAIVAERLAKLYGPACNILATDRACSDISTHVVLRYVDWVAMPGRTQPQLMAAILGQRDLAEASYSGGGGVDQGADGEWLYVLQSQTAGDVNAVANEAFHLAVTGRVQHARALLATAASGDAPTPAAAAAKDADAASHPASMPVEADTADAVLQQPVHVDAPPPGLKSYLAELLATAEAIGPSHPVPPRSLGEFYTVAHTAGAANE